MPRAPGFGTRRLGNGGSIAVILLLVALLFGIGTALEVALWTILIAVAVVVLLGLLARNTLARR